MAGGGLVSPLVLGLSSRLDSDIFLTSRASSTSPSPPATTARLEMDLETGSLLTAARAWTNQRSARPQPPPITAHLGLAVVRGGGPRPLLAAAAAATLLARTRDLQVALLLQQYNLNLYIIFVTQCALSSINKHDTDC